MSFGSLCLVYTQIAERLPNVALLNVASMQMLPIAKFVLTIRAVKKSPIYLPFDRLRDAVHKLP